MRSVPTPGAYLKARRCAAGFSIAEVAASVATTPRLAAHLRAEWIELIEADVMPATFSTIVALRSAVPFDLNVLATLDAAVRGLRIEPPQLCRICMCSESDPCVEVGGGCCWEEPDLCSTCARIGALPERA